MKRTATVWRPDEIECLMNHKSASLSELQRLLPDRTYYAIAIKKSRLGICGEVPKETQKKDMVRKRDPWTVEEIRILKERGSELTISELEKLIPTHHRNAIYNYARRHNYKIKESDRGRSGTYSEQQKEYVSYFYPRKGAQYCASALGITVRQVRYLVKVIRKNKK